MKNIKVSVIVPIYNSEKYIRTCLESLIKQTLKPIEIILVNDGSTDRSIDHIFDLIEKYNFIRLIEIENSGAAEARNKGLALARGNYISFVDSDDFVHLLFLKNFIKKLKIKNLISFVEVSKQLTKIKFPRKWKEITNF
ncbi:glycosyltransferase [Lactococcus cremoris]|uniref:glycosyltransferase n=1 Tax=Lactococcus lactis subsp. cremoris TaxID=1359 RepID=UPI00040409AA|nr:glycosyltransferase [Lactococcus cremoris]WKB12541.1 glycosyltransferase [Lactococcus cremoris]WKB14502.1 glycosyltransferase [Lactococcus cremoris]